MKYLFFTLLFANTAYADEISIHSTSLYLIILFLCLALMISYAFYIYKATQRDERSKKQEKKIANLQKKKLENKNEYLQHIQKMEKEISNLKHTIVDLERQIQEGTKNQVVSKLEALQKKRQSAREL